MVLRRHGLVAPSTTYSLIASLRDAADGTSVTGLDGDGIFGSWSSWRPWAVLRGRVRPEPRDVLRIAKIASPSPVRRAWVRHRSSLDVEWLLPDARTELERAWRSWWASEPVVWDKRVAWWVSSRLIVVMKQAMALLADDMSARMIHPFLESNFLAALARAGGWSGFGDRTATMKVLFGELLPREVFERSDSDKADFTAVYWTERSKEFAAQWTGVGVPLDIVDPEALRATWTSELPDARSGLLLQAAWLATSDAPDVEQHFNSDFD
jgi:asparagine synthase (glutamine-hydrolysing)